MAKKRRKRRHNAAGHSRRRRGGRRRHNPGLFVNPRRRGRRRRNPFGVSRGIVAQGMSITGDAIGVVAGKAASRAIPVLLNLGMTGFAGVALQLGAGVGAGWLASFINKRFGRAVIVGAVAGVVEGFAKAANVPVLSPALGDEYDAVMGMYLPGATPDVQQIGAYLPAATGGAMSGYGAGGEGEDITDSVGFSPG